MYKFLTFLVLAVLLSSCQNDVEELLSCDSPMLEKPQTRSIDSSNDSGNDSIELLPESEELFLLKQQYELRNKSLLKAAVASTDDFFSENIYAIREMPITIMVRSVATGSTANNKYMFVKEKGKEVTLGNSGEVPGSKFYLKILPATSGIPYLIYSNVTKTPLAVGQYTNNPDNKILMTAKDESGSTFSMGWDLLPASSNKGYFAIESQSYLGQSDPNNMWSVFNYVLEAKADNKIGYAQRVNNKAQQEFQITPVEDFALTEVKYDLENATINYGSDIYGEMVEIINTSDEEIDNMPFSTFVSGIETSQFSQQQGKLNLKIVDMYDLVFPRPVAIAKKATITGVKSDASYKSSPQKFSRRWDYNNTVTVRKHCLLQLTCKFKTFNLEVPYTATAQCDGRIVKVAGTWKGNYIANPDHNKPTLLTHYYDLETGEELMYSMEYDETYKRYTINR
ncbi:MAG: hypothetical protein K2L17_05995 [Muribaculaceae bacterium]|nr:hypothetical protein [Muribaculaceae bacterium]